MRLFREAPESMFIPQRAAELKAFAQKAQAFDQQVGGNAGYLVDMLSVKYSFWSRFLHESKSKGRTPLEDSKGNLDFLAACIIDGVEDLVDWRKVSGTDYQSLQWDLALSGLHGLHFRVGLNDPSDRIKHTMGLAVALYGIQPNSFRHYLDPLIGQSVLGHSKKVRDGYEYEQSISKKLFRVSANSALLLASGQDRSGPDQFKELLGKFLCNRGESLDDLDRRSLALRIEILFLPLVYNFGYRLKAGGLSNEVVCQKASAHIDCLLDFLAMDRESHNALKRQVLINLFSAFPDGLAMLSAKPEELHGVMLDPVLIDNEDANLFVKTLAGPLRLFSGIHSVKASRRSAQVIEFFESSGYPLDFEMAAQGRLQSGTLIVELFSKSHPDGHSDLLEKTLTGAQPPIAINDILLLHLMVPARLSLYSDPALMKLVELTLEYFKRIKEDPKTKNILAGLFGIDQILKDRPHLREGLLERLVEQSLLEPKIFDWCGFGHREIKSLGKLAPTELKSHVLTSALGL